ncbi:histidine kinase [Lacihabitans sp. LS3-19]|uniref:tetratricopeptide repeat-containing sensor histidine kinase n=1 Tax=Lacihabitans sp. LS3-19 TaxID=2487335 RepID=UPI0020CF5E27|nr:histidine kinase [Lacihabitans sp. LS3-19]
MLVAQDPAIIPKSEDSLVLFLKTYPKDTVYVRALRPYTLKQIYDHADYKKADSLIVVIKQLSEKLNYGRGIYFHYLLKALVHNQKTESKLALENFKMCLGTVKKYKLNKTLEESSLNNIAVGYEQLGDRENALKYALMAVKVQEDPNYPVKWLDHGPYGMVSSIYKFRKNYEEAIKYNKMAFEIAEKKEDKIGMAIHKNKLGNILDDQSKTNEALKEYQMGLKLAEDANYPLLQTDLLDNVGRLLMQTKRYVEAEKYLKRNESLSESLKSPEAQKSAYHSLGELYNVQGKFNLANAYFKKAYSKAKDFDDYTDKYTTSKSLSESFAQLGDYRNAYQYLLEANVANDSVFSADSDEKMQELLTKYESKKKEAEIKQLETEKKQANMRLILLAILGALVAVIAFLAFNSYKSKQRIKVLENTQKLRNRISADLHDEIGSTLSSISILSELVAFQQKKEQFNPEIMTQVSNDARNVIEKMDEIIWTINPDNDEFYNLETRLKSYAIPMLESKDIDFKFDFSTELENIKIDMGKRRDIYLILKEAINNLVKYSNCKNAKIVARINDKALEMSVSDDGFGFDMNAKSDRNGQKNMHSRAKKIGAHLDITSELGKGTKVALTIPI